MSNFVFGFACGIALIIVLTHSPRKAKINTCDEAAAEIIAMQACLSNRPQCQIPDGPTAYKVYHDAQVTWRNCTEGESNAD